MITAAQIRELLRAQPFKPFRLWMTDGQHYDIHNHDGAMVLQNYVEVGLDPDAAGIANKVVRCAILHITRLEDINTVAA